MASRQKAPDGTEAVEGPYRVEVPANVLGDRGTVSMWFKVPKTLRGPGPRLNLLGGDALSATIEPRRDSVRIVTRFGTAMTGRRKGAVARPYACEILLTLIQGGRWYHAGWTWDCNDANRNGFFLDGIRQGAAPPYEYSDQVAAATSDVIVSVGAKDLTTSAIRFYREPLGEQDLRAICRAAGHEGYTDEGVRFSGEKFVPRDVDWDHPIYETSFDDPVVLNEWRLEGGRRMSVAGGNLVLESDTQSTQSEARANHLVCWLTREVPADFLLEFTVRPQDRKRGLNIVFFNARGLRGGNIFEPPIQPRDGTFSQYHSGDINNYHISYWSGGRGTANLRKNKGFYLAAVGEDLVWTAPQDIFQTIRIYKRGGMIRLMVDNVVALTFDDDGKTYGPVHTHSGWIGLRQMGHAHRCEYGHARIYPLRTQ